MPAFSGELAHHFHDHLGLVTDRDLRRLGVSVDERRRLVAGNVLVRVVGDVYRVTSTPESVEQWCLAACLADERAVITGRAGGRLWNLRKMGAIDVVDVRVPHFVHVLASSRFRLRRCDVLPPEDIVIRGDGIRVVSPPRLAFDLAAVLSDDDLESVIEQLLADGRCTVPTLTRLGRRLYAPARAGSGRFARVLNSRPGWLRPVESDHELVLGRALERAGVTGLVRQHAVPVPAGWIAHPDLAIPALQWAIEIDHVDWHGGRVAAQRDKQRDRQLRLVGWQIDRVTDHDIEQRLREVTAELVALWRLRCAEFGRRAA